MCGESVGEIDGASMVESYRECEVEVRWRRLVWSEDSCTLEKEENFGIVYLSDLCVAGQLLCVASWVAAHMRDQKYPLLLPGSRLIRLSVLRSHLRDKLSGTYMTRSPVPTARLNPCPVVSRMI